MTHQLVGLGAGLRPPRAPLGPALCPKVLCHALSCGSGSLIPEFWEAQAEFPEGVSQFSKQIGCFAGTAEPGRPACRSGGGWYPRGQRNSPSPVRGWHLTGLVDRKGNQGSERARCLAEVTQQFQGSNLKFWSPCPTDGREALNHSRPTPFLS